MMNELDVSNSEFLDESFSNAVDAGAIGGILGSVASVFKSGSEMKATRADMGEKTSCEKPNFFAGKKKKNAYKQCLSDAIEDSKKRVEAGKQARTESLKSMVVDKQKEEVEKGKILGMPKTVFWIGLGVLVLVVGGFITYKVIKAKQVKI